MSTLRSKLVFACDKDFLSFKCPNNTVITIENANYGRQVPNKHMCPYRWSTVGSYQVKQFHEDTNCKAINSRQIIQNMCESRQLCKISVSSDLFGGDPCPGTNKYLDVTYKCKPSTFRNMVVCEDSHMMLHCDNKEVLAIHSAGFGRPIAENMKCPSFTMDETECESHNSLEEVMKRCHGKRHCAVKASTRVFGEPCQQGTYKYLSVIYTCVSKRIFRKPRRFTGIPTVPYNFVINPTFPTYSQGYDHRSQSPKTMSESTDNQPGGDIFSTTGSSVYATRTPYNISYEPTVQAEQEESMGFFTGILAAIGYIQMNTEVFILYMSIGCCMGVLVTLLWCVIRLQCQNYDLKKKLKESNIPKSDTDAVNRTLSRNGSILESVRQENREDINEIWNTPPPPPPSTLTPRPENGFHTNRRWDSPSPITTPTREVNSLPATRNLNSYFP
ncbi:protein eva-1 homolog C-like [Asterias rubens]|uniref:protein eva-1 homolog C-like n=1 Tax=Asterias rubens TaxID=7604 RepID=UPI0014554A65|nr:protein eva-1 homolog C-like [Asterias rubens]